MDWVLAHASTIAVANLSFGMDGTDTGNCGAPGKKVKADPMHAAICAVVASGVTVVAAAGNDALDASGHLPAAYPEVIAVSALADSDGQAGGLGGAPVCAAGELDDHLATFSNFGSVVDIAAPGVCISSTYLDGGYAFNSGTSFSSPLVAGAAALVRAKNPTYSPSRIRQRLLDLAEPGPIAGDTDGYAEGVLNVSRL
jgi:subtilisin family serine protease